MERYPFDVLPSGSLFSDLVDFTDNYDDLFLNETYRQMAGGQPIPLHLRQEPLDFAGYDEFGEQSPGFSNLLQEEPLSSNDSPNNQLPECDIMPQLEPIQYDYLPQKEQPQAELIQYNDLLQEEQPQQESIKCNDLPQEEQSQLESIQCNDLPQEEQSQLESIQYNDLPQKEQSQGAAPPQEIIYPECSYRPQQKVWVQPLSALFIPSDKSSTTTLTIHSVKNEPVSNSKDRSVVVSGTTQRLFARNINVIETSPIIGISRKRTCGDIPAIATETSPPQREERNESIPKKIPVPVLLVKPLEQTRKSRPYITRNTPSLFIDCNHEYRCDIPGCQKIFKSTSHRKEHKKTHSDLKPYKCDKPLCGWKFARHGELNRHISSKHSVEKHYQCDSCEKRFARQDHFAKHLKTCGLRKSQRKNK